MPGGTEKLNTERNTETLEYRGAKRDDKVQTKIGRR